MEIVLAIATILGGITALWFFWDKFAQETRTENKDSLSEVNATLRSLQSPLLPCGLFFTLRHSLDDDHIKQIFEEKENGLKLASLPVPPLPPGMTDARVHFPDGYIDYSDRLPKEGGIYRIKHPGYNIIHEPISKRFSAVVFESINSSNSAFFKPTSISIEFFFNRKADINTSKPSLALNSCPTSDIQVTSLSLLDNVCYSDLAVSRFTSNSSRDAAWSIQDVKNSLLRVRLEFLFIQGINDIPEPLWPRVHNLQIWMGPDATKVLSFRVEELKKQVVQENPKPIVSGQARQVQICFEPEIGEELYVNNILSSA